METVRRQIEVTRQARKEIKAAFKCSDMALWRALTFWNDTDMSLRIRKLAMAKGGILLCLSPAEETIHDHEGCMRQYFGNGAMIEADTKTGTAQVFDKNGTVRRTIESCTIMQLTELQEFANQLS